MNDKTELIYHAMRARELCADAVSLTLRWDPTGAVCAWGIQVLQDIENNAESIWEIGGEVDDRAVHQELERARGIALPASKDEVHAVCDAWLRVRNELMEVAAGVAEGRWIAIARDIDCLVADHIECNIIAEEEV